MNVCGVEACAASAKCNGCRRRSRGERESARSQQNRHFVYIYMYYIHHTVDFGNAFLTSHLKNSPDEKQHISILVIIFKRRIVFFLRC